MMASAAPHGDFVRNPITNIVDDGDDDDDEISCRTDATTVVISNRLPRSPEMVRVRRYIYIYIHHGNFCDCFIGFVFLVLVFGFFFWPLFAKRLDSYFLESMSSCKVSSWKRKIENPNRITCVRVWFHFIPFQAKNFFCSSHTTNVVRKCVFDPLSSENATLN